MEAKKSCHSLKFCPDIIHNLLSICMLAENKCEVCFKDVNVYVISDACTTLVGRINKNHYVVGQSACANVLINYDVKSKPMKWNNMLEHIGYDNLSRLAKNELIAFLDKVNFPLVSLA